ncbi:hypothetical protein K505DRAFT_172 [Melanomma pulvis-pyrius CBS 109.77]|uniref:Uncharacterized protein n=1 Tax=Melanomma pulvis-pyrius CBS 109.77 TaxID=1314802 RepID=A0A6A6XYN0_9PLEO|nr:hypothetical protein K505DRAFT_172 [Melanomma pulvis-pyrius CBS 109.77]
MLIFEIPPLMVRCFNGKREYVKLFKKSVSPVNILSRTLDKKPFNRHELESKLAILVLLELFQAATSCLAAAPHIQSYDSQPAQRRFSPLFLPHKDEDDDNRRLVNALTRACQHTRPNGFGFKLSQRGQRSAPNSTNKARPPEIVGRRATCQGFLDVFLKESSAIRRRVVSHRHF